MKNMKDWEKIKAGDIMKELTRGDVVVAKQHIDPEGADVRPGTIGVVFEVADADCFRDLPQRPSEGFGPMVRWMNLGACNIYEGDAELLHSSLRR